MPVDYDDKEGEVRTRLGVDRRELLPAGSRRKSAEESSILFQNLKNRQRVCNSWPGGGVQIGKKSPAGQIAYLYH